ncbi:MAG: 5-oxoprolinase subunit PxpB [Verrucomicrobia bacterium]|nr:5-oxoprolinase subunit PxpB [Verrucomicrobiota bacterium]
MDWTPYGPHAALVRFADEMGDEAFARCGAIRAELERNPPEGLLEFVPACTTVLLEFSAREVPSLDDAMPDILEQLQMAAAVALPPEPVKEIPVIYDGQDLERVARTHNLTTAEVCRLHTEPVYKVYMLGFAPGFPYLGDLDARLHTPRLATPRARVPAGSVAIGGQHTGIYTVDTPGGWNIIGHTPAKIFDPARRSPDNDEAMFLLKQGDRVKFVRNNGP